MKRIHWQGSAWWVDPSRWADDATAAIVRPTEDTAIQQIRQQAEQRRLPLLRIIVMLEHWYHDVHPEIIPFVRLQLIAQRLDMSLYQVSDALHEATRMMESGRW
jgi:hypothetical protein